MPQWLQSTADPTVKGAPALHRRVGQPPQAVLAGRRGMGDGARVAVGPATGQMGTLARQEEISRMFHWLWFVQEV